MLLRALFAAACLAAPSALLAEDALKFDAPIKNFRLPRFNEKGFRSSYLRAGEARYRSSTRIDVTAMNLAVFRGDGTMETQNLLVAPSASVLLDNGQLELRGDESMRLVRDDLEVTGEQWTFSTPAKFPNADSSPKKLWIGKNVRVVFHAPLPDLIK